MAFTAHIGSVAKILQSSGDALHPVDIRMVLRELEGIELSTQEVLCVLGKLASEVPPRALKKSKWRWVRSGDPSIEGTVDLSRIGNWDAEWTKDEFIKCCALFHQLDGERLSEPTIEIHELALVLGRRVRQVEAQLLMFRPLADPAGERWSRTFKNSNTILKEVWNEYGQVPDQTRQGVEKVMNPFVTELANRGFGREDAVVVLGHRLDESTLPESDAPAGVESELAKLEGVLGATGGGEQEVVFLVGGPGNGKSHQAQSLIDRLEDIEETGDLVLPGLAPRKYEYKVPAGRFLVVNDATIRDEEDAPGLQTPGELAKDIASILNGEIQAALVCVNRGILIEELAQLKGCEDWDNEPGICVAAQGVIEWLHKGQSEEKEGVGGDYYLEKTFSNEKVYPGKIKARGLFLDQLSLLERQPDLAGERDYVVATPGSDARLDSPASRLLEKVISEDNFEAGEACPGCSARELCPILANAKNLRHKDILKSVIDMLRAAEVVSGQLFSYRDLWAVIGTLVAGPAEMLEGDAGPCSQVIKTVEELGSLEGVDKKQAYYALSRFRFYESLFSSQSPLVQDSPEVNSSPIAPGIGLLRRVDPVLDSTFDWAEEVHNAMQAISTNTDPLSYLGNKNPDLGRVIETLDEKVSGELVQELISDHGDPGDALRRRLMQWRGHSLYRLYGVCTGNYAHKDVVNSWLSLRNQVITDSDGGLDELVGALRNLLLPNLVLPNGHPLCYLPLMEPRVSPVVSRSDLDSCCYGVQSQSLRWEFFTEGDSLWARLYRQKGSSLTELRIDFSLCREALISAIDVTNGIFRHGFTEGGSEISPRLERVRASFISRQTMEEAREIHIVGGREIVKCRWDK